MAFFASRFFKMLSPLAAIAYMALIFYLSSKPALGIPPYFPHQDKVFHFLCFAILGCLYANALPTNTRIWIVAALVSLYGITDEIHQSFVPGRSADILDWLADSAGGFTGAYIHRWLFSKITTLRNRF